MQKDFTTWNEIKTKTQAEQPRLYTVREIWWCRIGLNVGYEQDGSGTLFLRPVVIVRALGASMCVIIPLTTSSRTHALRVFIPHQYLRGVSPGWFTGDVQGKKATALLSQMRVIDTRRLVEKVGFLDKEIFAELRKALRALF